MNGMIFVLTFKMDTITYSMVYTLWGGRVLS